MKKFSLICMAVSLLSVSAVDAAVYKGQGEYVKKCRKCHGDGQKFVASKEISQWEELMKSDGKKLAAIHLKSEEAKKSWEYFEDSRFKKKAKHLKNFMTEYAADSGNVPACN